MPSRVLLIGPTPPPYAGVETVTEQIRSSPELQSRFDLLFFNTRKPITNEEKGRLGPKNLWYNFRHLCRLVGMMLCRRPRLVHLPLAQNLTGFARDAAFAWMARLLGASVVFHSHGGAFPQFYARQSEIIKAVIRRTLRMAASIIVLGECLRDQFDGLVSPHRLCVIPNGVEVNGQPPNRDQDTLYLLFMGHISKAKGAVDLIRAMLIVGQRWRGPLHLTLSGSPIDRERNIIFIPDPHGAPRAIDALARDLPAHVTLNRPGFVTGPEKERLFREADLFVLPSYSESACMAVLEAMAAGLPVVTTRVGALSEEVIDGQTGFLVESGAVEELAERIVALVGDAALRHRMGEAGRQRVIEQYSVERFRSSLLALWTRLLDER